MKTTDSGSAASRPLTARGKATRTRIVQAAAKRVYAQGARATSLDEVMEDSRTSKSQLYHYFANKDALLHAVIELQTSRVMESQSPYIHRLDSMEGLWRWRDVVVAFSESTQGVGGCPIGSLASELSDRSESARLLLVGSFKAWEGHLLSGLSAMRDRGVLAADADIHDLGTAAMSALQGGILLAQTQRTARPLRLALDMAINNIARHVRVPAA